MYIDNLKLLFIGGGVFEVKNNVGHGVSILGQYQFIEYETI